MSFGLCQTNLDFLELMCSNHIYTNILNVRLGEGMRSDVFRNMYDVSTQHTREYTTHCIPDQLLIFPGIVPRNQEIQEEK